MHRPASTRCSRIVAARCGQRPIDGLFRYAGNHWSRVTDADGYDGDQAFSVYEDRAGRVWVGAARGLYRHDGTQLRLVDRTATYVDSLVEDDAGNLWVTNRAGIVRKLDTSSPLRLDPRIRLPLPGWRIIPDGRGGLLVASFSGGLFRLANPTGAHPLLEPVEYEHRMRGSPRALYRDRDDNIWVGMRGGLLRLSENTFQSAGPLDGLEQRRRANRGGRRRRQHLDRRHAGPEPSRRRQPAIVRRLPDARPPRRSLGSDVGGDRRVRRPLRDGPSSIKERIPDVQASRVNGLTTTADALWLCTASRGVLSWNGNTLVSYRQPGESGGQCSSILADRHDRVWAGFSSGGVALHEHGRVRALTERDGLAPGLVWQIVQGNDDDVWFATSGGVSRYQHGRFTSVTTAHAPITGVVPMLVEDAQGYVWVGVHSGAALMRFHAGEMDKIEKEPNHRLAYTLYDESDGLQPGTQMWQNGAAGRARHGRADLGRQRPRHDDHRPAATARSAPCVAAEPGSRHRQRRARQPGGRPAVRERQHGADRIRRPQPLGDVEAALPPPARRRRRGLGVRRGRPARHLRQPAGRRLSIPCQHHGGRRSGPSRRCGRSPSIRRSI